MNPDDLDMVFSPSLQKRRKVLAAVMQAQSVRYTTVPQAWIDENLKKDLIKWGFTVKCHGSTANDCMIYW